LSEINWTEIKAVYHSVGWMKHDEDKIKEIFSASTIVALAYYEGRIVGLGRALSDGVFNAAIYDVVVHKQFHKQGIGKMLIENLLEHLQDISCVHLITTTGNNSFYEKCGFRNVKTAMARYLNPVLAREYLD